MTLKHPLISSNINSFRSISDKDKYINDLKYNKIKSSNSIKILICKF